MKILKKITLILTIGILLTSCSFDVSFSPYDFSLEFVEQKTQYEDDVIYRNEEFDTLSWFDRNNNEHIISSLRDVYSSKTNTNPQTFINTKSIGEITPLVIPVQFLGADTSDNENKISHIKNAFFGASEKTSYLSLSDYYYRSSYGQLKIDGIVSDFYNCGIDVNTLLDNKNAVGLSRKIAREALDNFYKTNPDLDFSIFDRDNDKYIDALYIIYDYEYSYDKNSIFWAYVDYSYRGEGKNDEIKNDHDICIANYAWISYDFFNLDKYTYPDPHTIIHESGHLFGLEDYYNTSGTGIYQPTGFMDMMDCNLGDHSGFSKMLLNWVTPYVIKDKKEVTLRPFIDSGDLLLIPNSKGYNNTPYDEYLLLEFYSPTGVNKEDANKTYVYIDGNGKERKFSYFTNYGLKVYHVDARLGLFESKNSGYPFAIFAEEDYESNRQNFIDNRSGNFCVDFAYDNSPYYGENTPVLYHLIESSGANTFKEGLAGSNSTLFTKGDSFGVDTFTDFTFNNGGSFDYPFIIKDMNKHEITISFDI